jgi:Fe-S cluster assembly protein SufD
VNQQHVGKKMQQLRTDSPTWVQDGFAALESNLNGGCDRPEHLIRRRAFEQLGANGFPTTKVEEWKYTNLSTVLKTPFSLAEKKENYSSAQLDAILGEIPSGPRLVFVNGQLQDHLSDISQLDSGVEAVSLSKAEGSSLEALISEHLGAYANVEASAIVALNTAFLGNGVCVRVKKDVVSETPLEVLYYSTKESKPYVAHNRVLIVAEDGSQVEVNERYFAENGAQYLTSAVAEVVVGKKAKVVQHRLQCESLEAFHVTHCEVRQADDSQYQSHAITFGGSIVRNDINPILLGERTDTVMNGLSILAGTQHVDNHTVLEHVEPNCESNEWYKGIYADKSKGNFSGTIIVRQDAQKTNAIQNNQSLLLSPDAESNAKPQLKIWADDVRCTHGATIGQLDDDALFYLRSRGIPEDKAHHVLHRAFAGDITEQIENQPLREKVEQLLQEKLA